MKTMLVTGATRGLGRGLVDYYILGYLDFDVRGCARNIGTDYICNVTNENNIRDMLLDIKQVDILINCAGVASMNHLLLTPTDNIEDILNTNLLGTILMCQEVGKMMAKQKFGRIINISTIAVPLTLAGEAVYVASKAGVEAFTKVLAKEMYTFGVTVNCVAPTVIDIGGLAAGVSKEKIGELLDKTITKKVCTVEQTANVVDFFIENEMVTGQTIYLGGV